MNATDLKYFRKFLLQQKGSLLNKRQDFLNDQLSHGRNVADDAEIASAQVSQNVTIELHERERAVLYEIEKALGKIESGQFGVCECCGDIIGVSRLKARPFASLCLACKEEQEDSRPVHH